MKKIKLVKKALVSALLLLMLVHTNGVFASEENRVGPIDPSQECSLEIELSIEDEENTIIISGMEIEIYRVAEISEINGSVFYTSLPPFDTLSVDYTQLTDAAASNQVAQQLSELIGQAEGILAVTNTLGIARITNLEWGMYLVVPVEEVDGYSFDPFFVSVPFVQQTVRGENIWDYQVAAKPKAGNRRVEPDIPTIPEEPKVPEVPAPPTETPGGGKPVPPVKTGDDANIQFLIAMIGISLLGIGCIIVIKKKNSI